MLKIAVFDCGFGGELFADHLENELPIVQVIRVIDRRSAGDCFRNWHDARKAAEKAIRPYLGKVDLIVIANYLLASTSLTYFRRKYKAQKFIGFSLYQKRIINKRPTLVITTKATTRSLTYVNFAHRIKAKTVCFDTWPLLIDHGAMTDDKFRRDLNAAMSHISDFSPKQILLACGHFTELKPAFRSVFGHNVRIIDGYDDVMHDVYAALNLRGARCEQNRKNMI